MQNVESTPTNNARAPGNGFGFGLLSLEFRKLIGFRSVRLGMLLIFVLPFFLTFAPDGELAKLIGVNLILVSGWQVPALGLYIATQFVLPLLVSVTCAELIGGEVSWGTLAPLLLRPVSRVRVIGTKLFVAILYPLMLLVVLFIGGVIAGGVRFGLGAFAGGTGLGAGGFTGVGVLEIGGALTELARGFLVAGLTLAPIAGLAVLFGVIYMNTAAASLGTIATIQIMKLLEVFPPIKRLLLTHHQLAFAPGQNAVESLILLTLYTVGTLVAALFVFERKDL
jgi:ABC-2 type transport system permease protein